MVHYVGKEAATGGVGFRWLGEKPWGCCSNGDQHCGWWQPWVFVFQGPMREGKREDVR
jgi:hypothetical protein